MPIVARAEAPASLQSTDIYSHVVNTHGVQTLQAEDLFAPAAPLATTTPANDASSVAPVAGPMDIASPIADRLPVQHNAIIVKFPNRLD